MAIMKHKICLFIIFLPAVLFAEDKFDVNENILFSNPDSVVESSKPENAELDNTEGKKSVGISGEILSVFPYTVSRDYITDNNSDHNMFKPYMFGNLQFDARLTGSYKGFANADLEYHPDTSSTDAYLRELFIDFNFARTIYFRAGKQVLKWGRCYLWNPTDVINIEKTPFIDRVQSREGTYGLKMSVPFGTSVNMYGFADMYHTENIDDIGGAYKLEFLIGNNEMAFSIWGKKGYHPVGGYDFSTRIFGWDIVGEATVSHGSNTEKVRVVNGTLETYREDDKWIPKAAVDFGREFDGRDISKRYSLKFEFFYNGAGYSHKIFRDTSVYYFDKPVIIEGYPEPVTAGDKISYLSANGLYEPNYLSEYYAAVFAAVNKLFISELSFSLNAIASITDASFIISAGLAYQNINDFKAGLTVNAYPGRENMEYTVLNNAADVLLTAGILF